VHSNKGRGDGILSDREEKLRKLEEALLEGRISEETYKELRAKYEMEGKKEKKARTIVSKKKGEEEGVVEKIKEVFETAKSKAEVKLIESKMDKVAERIGKRVYELIKSGEYEATDAELKSLVKEMEELEREKEKLRAG